MGCTSSKGNKSNNDEQKTKYNEDKILNVGQDVIYEDPKSKYKIGVKLGNGSYGVVYKVELHGMQHNKQPRAMKQVPENLLSTKEQKYKMVNDIEVLKNLTHPNILKVYEYFYFEKSYWIISEYCSEGELFQRIEDSQSLSEQEASLVIKQVLQVLVYCKKQKIAHRDLKPDNIMIDSFNQKTGFYDIKIIDWGCSKKYKEGQKMTDLVGTPYFIAPEVIKGSYDYKCDIWSLGTIMYTLLCGHVCFNGNSIDEVMENVSKGKWSFKQHKIWDSISQDAQDLIKKMIEYDPKKRIEPDAALEHEWIKNAPDQKIAPELMKEACSNMKKFRCKNQLGYYAMTFITTQLLAKEEKEKYSKAFKELDGDNNGTLTKDEILKYYLKDMGYDQANEQVNQIMEKADQNQNGQINYEEFLVAVADYNMATQKEKIKQAFNMFDKDGNGRITVAEIKQMLQINQNQDVKQNQIDQIIGDIDKNKDGEIDIEEFTQLLKQMAV